MTPKHIPVISHAMNCMTINIAYAKIDTSRQQQSGKNHPGRALRSKPANANSNPSDRYLTSAGGSQVIMYTSYTN